MEAITTYFQEALSELRQVRWPTRQQAVRLSLIVIAFTAAVSVAFGLIDYALGQLVQAALSLSY